MVRSSLAGYRRWSRKHGKMRGRKRKHYAQRKRVGRFKRRRGNTSASYRQYVNILKRTRGVRKFHEEVRNTGLETGQNKVLWEIVANEGDKTRLESIILSTLGQDGATLGDNPADEQRKNLITNYHATTHFRNVSTHPVFLTIYEITPRKDGVVEDTLTDMKRKCMSDLMTGWDLDTGAGSTSSTLKSGKEDTTFTPGDFSGTTFTQFRSPRTSRQFMRNWRINRNKLYKLAPGADVFWTLHMKNRVHNPVRELEVDTSQSREWTHGYAKMLLVKVCGTMGVSDDVGEHGVVGLMNSHLTVDCFSRCRVLAMTTKDNALALTLGHDAIEGAEQLEGPGDHDLLPEAP